MRPSRPAQSLHKQFFCLCARARVRRVQAAERHSAKAAAEAEALDNPQRGGGGAAALLERATGAGGRAIGGKRDVGNQAHAAVQHSSAQGR